MILLKKGSKGEEVKTLQTILNANGASLEIDGKFGKKTKSAVIEYQEEHGLKADGIVGDMTWGSLLGEEPLNYIIECEDIKQFSAPHGSMIYGKDSSYSTYKSGGCGVASFSIVQRYYGLVPEGETQTQTVQRLGRYSWEHGYRIKGGGTSAGLFSTNGTKAEQTTSKTKIVDAIMGGKLVILNIKKGFSNGYGGEGHYVVMRGIQGNTVLLRDVGSSLAARQKAKLDSLTTGLKRAYIITKK